MRPRGLRSPWRKATPTYWYEPIQPSRMVERARAIAEDMAADEEPRQTTGGPGDRAAEGGEGQEVAVTLPLSSSSA